MIPFHEVHVEFDGGTPCNIPRLGYGDGYGSYRVNQGMITRVKFNEPMSNNVAEIRTLIKALEYVIRTYDPYRTKLTISGDSMIALSRCTKRLKMNAKACRNRSVAFQDACDTLASQCAQFAKVETNWRGRSASVALFGH